MLLDQPPVPDPLRIGTSVERYASLLPPVTRSPAVVAATVGRTAPSAGVRSIASGRLVDEVEVTRWV